MITDSAVFEDEQLPRRLLHREAAVDHLSRAWEPALDGEQAHDVLIHGPSGVGKTSLARFALQKLTRHADIHSAHVESLGKSTAGVVRSILHDLPGSDPATNTPREDLCIELRERVDQPTIVILDEADDLPATDALDRLADVDGLSVVAICHDKEQWLSQLDNQLRRRLLLKELALDRFGVNELADILEARARRGLPSGVVTREQLEEIADEVAGVARKGIQSLRQAALLAEERDHSEIGADDVADSYERAQRYILEQNLESLPFHHQLLYELIRVGSGLKAGELHDRYEAVAEEVYHGRGLTPISERSRRLKLSKLEDYELIEVEGENRHRKYSVTETDIELSFSLNLIV
ncbi:MULTISPECIES: Cdc6/Cdc18 family protein [Halomicrobium]|uniref:AAA ATPase n=2 Tax=Halomicrobium mukohataei TaxID=57705 RepID=C7NXZ2_HALMD|nr:MULTISPECIES: AAA family ATPase [Halomicrobium]ACV46580.1 AAA ATPase [Halomicrobium mukohataei DSM 12286]QCD65120.1 AAA family ATPase [Halomicrobium mukohataei]QFR19926.1 AAA family ATPase [Halomicrobium sp. ZPS1]